MKNIFQRLIPTVLAFLNIFDAYATNYGLHYNLIEESNPLMNYIWHISPILFINIKIALSVLLLISAYFIFRYSRVIARKLFTFTVAGVSLLYGAICMLHIYWFIII